MNIHLWLAKTQVARKQWWAKHEDKIWAAKWLAVLVLIVAVLLVGVWNILMGWQADRIRIGLLEDKIVLMQDKMDKLTPLSHPIQGVEMKQAPVKVWKCKPRKNCKITWEIVK